LTGGLLILVGNASEEASGSEIKFHSYGWSNEMKMGAFARLRILSMLLTVLVFSLFGQTKDSKPQPRVVELGADVSDYQKVLSGPPQTVSMESGLVILAPSKSVGKHSTKSYEEAVIVFAGTGEMRITGGQTLKLKPNVVAYCPPLTEHDVVNTGQEPLRYLYVVAKPK
jgi:quercetin dioxygenase-like cupin family protein